MLRVSKDVISGMTEEESTATLSYLMIVGYSADSVRMDLTRRAASLPLQIHARAVRRKILQAPSVSIV